MEHSLVWSAFSSWMLTCLLLLPASSSGVVRTGLTKRRSDLHAINAARMARQEAVAGAGGRGTIKYLGKSDEDIVPLKKYMHEWSKLWRDWYWLHPAKYYHQL